MSTQEPLADVLLSEYSSWFKVVLWALSPGRQGWGCFVPRLTGTRRQQRSPCSFPRTQESKRIKGPSADHIYFII